MAFNIFSFDPEGGFSDSSFYEDTPADAREVLQRQHNQTRDYINKVVDTLNSVKEGESGSEHIASPAIDGVSGENVFSQLKDIKRQLKDASAGNLTDGSVDSAKLSKGCVTSEKIAGKSIGSEHFSADAVCPLSAETNKLNGNPAGDYTPLRYSSSFGFFKERVSDSVIKTVRGRNYGNERYFRDENGMIKKLSFEDLSVSDVVDFKKTSYRDCVFAKDADGALYFAVIDPSGSYTYVEFYKYTGAEVYLVNRFPLINNNVSLQTLADMEIYNGEIYLSYCSATEAGYCMVYIYKFPVVELPDLTEAAPWFSKHTNKIFSTAPLFIENGDLYFGNFRLKGISADACEEFAWIFIGRGDGVFLVSHSNYFMVDEKMLPCAARIYANEFDGWDYYSFMYENYVYTVLTDYLFRIRMF